MIPALNFLGNYAPRLLLLEDIISIVTPVLFCLIRIYYTIIIRCRNIYLASCTVVGEHNATSCWRCCRLAIYCFKAAAIIECIIADLGYAIGYLEFSRQVAIAAERVITDNFGIIFSLFIVHQWNIFWIDTITAIIVSAYLIFNAYKLATDAMVRSDLTNWRGDINARLMYDGNKHKLYGGLMYSPTISVGLLLGFDFHGINIGYSYEVYTGGIGALNGTHEILIGYQHDIDMTKKGKNLHKTVRLL